VRDRLFAAHPESPLPVERRAGFRGLRYFPYDPASAYWAICARWRRPDRDPTSVGGVISASPTGDLAFELAGVELVLAAYWFDGYAGGLFVPFTDAASGLETYGRGRYLLDTVKGADLGDVDRRLVCDFNFACNPSCVYDGRWSCPLPPPASSLALPIRGGERDPAERDRAQLAARHR
jgi:uncharacterized protein